MSNMSYCRFHNTLTDLYDCQGALEDFIRNSENTIASKEERMCAKNLIAVCKEIADNYEESDIDHQAEYFDLEENEEANDEYCQTELSKLDSIK